MHSSLERTKKGPWLPLRNFAYAPILVWVACLTACSNPDNTQEVKYDEPPARKQRKQASESRSPQKTKPGIALVVVDVQQDFFDPQTEMSNPNFVSNLKSMLETCRLNGIEVIHVRTAFSSDPNERPTAFRKFFGSKIPCVIGTPGIKALECARQTRGEKVFYKKSYDPFEIEELNEHLEQKQIGQVLVCGLTTDVCVLSTCFSATNKGFLTTLVEDCSATQNPMAHQFVISRYRGMLFDTTTSSAVKSKYSRTAADSNPQTRGVPASSFPGQR